MVNFVPRSHHKIILVEPFRTLGTFCCKQSKKMKIRWIGSKKGLGWDRGLRKDQNEELKKEERKAKERKKKQMIEIGIECETEVKVNGFSLLFSVDVDVIWIHMVYIWYEYTTILMYVFSSIFFSPFFNLCTSWSSWRWSLTTRISSFSSSFPPFSLPFLLLFTLFWFNLYSNLEKLTELNLLTLKE